MKTIAVFQRDLGVGGIQRSLLNLLRAVDGSVNIDLFLFEEPDRRLLDGLKTVRLTVLPPLPYRTRFVDIAILKRKARFDLPDKEYDTAIDFSSYSDECALCVDRINAKKKILWIHNDLEIEYDKNVKYRILYTFFKKKYAFYNEFAAVSPGVVEPFRRRTGLSDARISVVPNVIDTKKIFASAEERVDFFPKESEINVIFAGRFVYQKGLDILIESFAAALKKNEMLKLYLLGDGEERRAVEKLIAKYEIEDSVTLLGAKTNPYPYMDRCDALILTSRYEGQGMVLLEGKALGLNLVFPKRLEKYVPGLTGCSDVTEALAGLEKNTCKTRDDLSEYNERAIEAFGRLL